MEAVGMKEKRKIIRRSLLLSYLETPIKPSVTGIEMEPDGKITLWELLLEGEEDPGAEICCGF